MFLEEGRISFNSYKSNLANMNAITGCGEFTLSNYLGRISCNFAAARWYLSFPPSTDNSKGGGELKIPLYGLVT